MKITPTGRLKKSFGPNGNVVISLIDFYDVSMVKVK